MAYGNQFLKFTWLFSVAASDEIADTGLNFTSAPAWTGAAAALAELDPDGAFVLGMAARYGDLMDPLLISWADYSAVTGIKIAAIGTDGHYLTDPVTVELPGIADGSAVGIIPQSTVVLSLRSGFTLGKGNYGRMYLPHSTTGTETGTPRSSVAIASGFADHAAEWLSEFVTDINAETTATVFPAIMSQAAGTPSKGVTQVAVGRVTDTQRRRRNRLDEDYQFASLT